MAYQVALRPSAQRQLRRLHGPASVALHGALLALADDPRPRGAIKLAGSRAFWCLRVHIDRVPWRVVYSIDDRKRLVLVLRVARRDEGTYRALKGRSWAVSPE